MPNNSLFDRLSENPKFKPFMKKMSFLGAVLAVTGGFLKIAVSDDYGLLIVGVGMLAIFSFLLPWIYPQRNDSELEFAVRVWWQLALRLTGWGLCVLLMGVLFYVNHWPGDKTMLIIGGGTVIVSALAWLWYLKRRDKHKNIDTFK